MVGQELLGCYSIVGERFQQLYLRLELRESKFILFLIGGNNKFCCFLAAAFSHRNQSDRFFGPIVDGVLFGLSSAVRFFGRFSVSDSDGQAGASVLSELDRSLVIASRRLLLVLLLRIKWTIDVGNVVRLLIILIQRGRIWCLGAMLRMIFIRSW